MSYYPDPHLAKIKAIIEKAYGGTITKEVKTYGNQDFSGYSPDSLQAAVDQLDNARDADGKLHGPLSNIYRTLDNALKQARATKADALLTTDEIAQRLNALKPKGKSSNKLTGLIKPLE